MNHETSLAITEGIFHGPRGVAFPGDISQDEWLDYGRFLSRAKDGLIFWYTNWRDFGRKKFGDEFVRTSVAQLEFEFSTNKKADLLSSLPVRDPDLTAEHHFVLSQAKLDSTGLDMWVGLAKKESLSANELKESIRVGSVTKQEGPSTPAWGGGFATVQGIARQWSLLMRQIGDLWHEWDAREMNEFLGEIKPILDFSQELDSRLEIIERR